MIQRELLVENKLGLHARAAAKLVQLASRYSSQIHISRNGQQQEIDCKSILGLLMLAAGPGTRLVVTVQGSDENEAATAVVQLFTDKFGERS